MLSPSLFTGWSKKTVTCNFFLADLKVIKNCITQTFLKKVHREVLIFWHHNRVEWKKNHPFYGLAKKWILGKNVIIWPKLYFFGQNDFFCWPYPQKNLPSWRDSKKQCFCDDPVAWRPSRRPSGPFFGQKSALLAKYLHFWSKISFWHSPKRSDFFSPDPVVISKYQNLPIFPFQKCLSYAICYHF